MILASTDLDIEIARFAIHLGVFEYLDSAAMDAALVRLVGDAIARTRSLRQWEARRANLEAIFRCGERPRK